jgi:hypothetical protein
MQIHEIEVKLEYERVPWWKAVLRNRKRSLYDWTEECPELKKPDPRFKVVWPDVETR